MGRGKRVRRRQNQKQIPNPPKNGGFGMTTFLGGSVRQSVDFAPVVGKDAAGCRRYKIKESDGSAGMTSLLPVSQQN